MSDLISRQAAIEAKRVIISRYEGFLRMEICKYINAELIQKFEQELLIRMAEE